MTKTLKDYFKEFEDEVAGIVDMSYPDELIIYENFNLVRRFIKAQPLENQRDLWNTTVDLLNASKAFNDEIK